MEEPKPSVAVAADSSVPQPSNLTPPTTKTIPPPTTTATATATTTPSAAAGSSVMTTTKKRPLESDDDAHSNYYKIRAIIRDLRPHFVEVLRTPDYKNSKASQEVREQLKIVIKLYKNMKDEAASLGKSKQDGQPNMDHKTQQEQQPQHMKSPEQIQLEKSFARPSETKPHAPGLQKLQAEDGQGTYVVGGSAFGWNFITFSGKDAVYYGRTKEEFRSAQVSQ